MNMTHQECSPRLAVKQGSPRCHEAGRHISWSGGGSGGGFIMLFRAVCLFCSGLVVVRTFFLWGGDYC